jgi:glutaredoxin-like protein
LLSADDREYLEREFQAKLKDKVVLDFFSDGTEPSRLTEQILEELAALNGQISVRRHNLPEDSTARRLGIDKAPAIVVRRPGGASGVRFYGVPAGYEFGSLVEDIIDVSRGTIDLPRDALEELRELESDVHIQVFVTPGCPYCPRAVRTAHKLALASKHVIADMVMATDFNGLANRYGISAVPHTVVNEKFSFVGALPEREFLAQVLKAVGH